MGGGGDAAAAILEAGVPLSAVFVSTDTHAVDLMATFARAGVKVPDDVAVIGFDDSEIAQTAVPALTSIRQMPRSLGSAAGSLLLDLVSGVPEAAGTHVTGTALVLRHSCGCFEAQHEQLGASHDWTAPDWQDRLREVLEQALAAPSESASDTSPAGTWPGVEVVTRAFDSAIRGLPVSNLAELDEAWHSASGRTRNAETLLGLIDLLEFVGLCRQTGAVGDVDTIRRGSGDFWPRHDCRSFATPRSPIPAGTLKGRESSVTLRVLSWIRVSARRRTSTGSTISMPRAAAWPCGNPASTAVRFESPPGTAPRRAA
jgi:hypothetical protein